MIYQRLQEHANTQPNKIALIDDRMKLNYKVLNDMIKVMSFRIEKEILQNQLVGILLPNNINAILSLLSVPLSKNIAVPIDPTIKRKNFDLIVKRNNINHIITSTKYRELTESHPQIKTLYVEEHEIFQINTYDGVVEDSYVPISSLQGGTTAYIYFTTGTTGVPKGVMLTHNNLYASASNIIEYMNIDDSLIESIPMPLSHSFGFARLRVGLQVGGTIIIENGLLFINALFDKIIRYRANALCMVPAAYKLMLTTYLPLFKQFASNLKFIELGSASIKTEYKEQLVELCPNATICMHFGSTEASRSVFINFKEDADFLDSIGKASPNVELILIDDSGNIIEKPNTPGQMIVKSNNLAKGYWNEKDLTKSKFGPQGFKTGDYAKYDKSGYLYYLGKKENILNIDGFLVSPKEIESTISNYPGIVDVAVTSKPDDTEKSERIIAYIVKDKEIDTNELRNFCINDLESYKIPEAFIFIDEIPKTWSGKIEKFKLQTLN